MAKRSGEGCMNSSAQRKQQLIEEGALQREAVVNAAHEVRNGFRPRKLGPSVSGDILRIIIGMLSKGVGQISWKTLIPALIPLLARFVPLVQRILSGKGGLNGLWMGLITTGLTAAFIRIFKRKKTAPQQQD